MKSLSFLKRPKKKKSLDSSWSGKTGDEQSIDSLNSSPQTSVSSSCNGHLIQAEGDIQPSSSSHVSESSIENRNSQSPSCDENRRNSLDSYFVEAKLDFLPEDSDLDEDNNSCELRISVESLKQDVQPNSLISDESQNTIEKEKDFSFMSEDSSSCQSEDSYFQTASYESDGSVSSQTARQKRVVGSTNDVANKTTCAQVELSPAVPNCPNKTVNVFLTYAEEPKIPTHMHSIAHMAQTYHKLKYTHTGPVGSTTYEINFTADVYERQLEAESKSAWLDNQLKKADFVLVCVSPSYLRMVEEKTVDKDINETTYDNTVHTQYIYSMIHSEYIRNNSRNERFIPVLFSGATREDIPYWLRDTLIYRWNVDYKSLLFRLIKQEEHMKPTPGPPPVLQVRPRFQEKRRT